MNKKKKWILLISLIIATIVGVVILKIGFEHNSQGEFIDTETGVIDWGYSILLFFSWFILTFIVCFGIMHLIRIGIGQIKKTIEKIKLQKREE